MTDVQPIDGLPGIPPRDDERFEEVLERLDALVRRGQPEPEPPPPPPPVSEATIPVLTEVWAPASEPVSVAEGAGTEPDASPAEPAGSPPAGGLQLEQAMAEVLPVIAEVLETTLLNQLQPALDQAIGRTLAELRPQLEERLRQRLQQALAEDPGQTEI